jgi:hypothetical protein
MALKWQFIPQNQLAIPAEHLKKRKGGEERGEGKKNYSLQMTTYSEWQYIYI